MSPRVRLLALGPLACIACAHGPSGPVTTQPREPQPTVSSPAAPGGFSRIDLRGAIDVVVHEGGATAIAVTGSDYVQKHVRTTIAGDTLFVDFEPEWHLGASPEDNSKVTVTLPTLRAATLEGSGDLTIDGEGSHPVVEFALSGSGDVSYRGNADVLRCTIDGSGDIVLRGSGKRLEARVHGSGDVKGNEFPVEGGNFLIEGSGDIATVVHGGDIAVRIEGSGDLVYSGEARITSADVSGSGSVQRRGGGD